LYIVIDVRDTSKLKPKTKQMKNLTITSKQYLKAIELGFYELIKDVSVFKKIVRHYKLSGGFDEVLITLKNQ
tara:strand:+ start:4435 stop:4650 length:216 start_codon:yes stop_codon:yes gene_type:complete